ncbi:hypothetical protein N8S19_11640 [Enterobacter hormaechei subsp. steigerwaltii]|nr:hypothetical protein [Enterobacter hormaechei subsp. steigerwaltii]
MTNVSEVEKMAELMQQMEENSPRVAALQYCLKQVAEKVEEAEKRNAELEEERDATPGAVNEDAAKALAAMELALASLEAEAAQEWTNEQCLEFLSIAFRHAEIKGDLELDDIRLGVKMVNGSRAAMLNQEKRNG